MSNEGDHRREDDEIYEDGESPLDSTHTGTFGSGPDEEENEITEDESSMGFLEHLEEFRWTLARTVAAFVVGVILASIFILDIATFLQLPILRAYGSVAMVEENLITYRPMGVISVFIQVAVLSGLTLSMPFALYFIASFVAPGLTDDERSVLRPACLAAFVLFLSGMAFAFFFILPFTLLFSVKLNTYFGFSLFWAASDYYSMVVWFSLATGAFFQFPLIIVILVFLGVIPVQKLREIRKVVFVSLMVFSALMTPGGDFITLPVVTLIMYSLYELSIWVGQKVEVRRRLRAEQVMAKSED